MPATPEGVEWAVRYGSSAPHRSTSEARAREIARTSGGVAVWREVGSWVTADDDDDGRAIGQ